VDQWLGGERLFAHDLMQVDQCRSIAVISAADHASTTWMTGE
jgi:hypothetical protein